jgi:hypothetical protein
MTISRKTPPPRNYFSRREQFRLFVLVMSLGLVFWMMNEARKPERWQWLTGSAAQDATAVTKVAPAKPRPDGQKPRPPEEVPGAFVAPAQVEASEAAATVGKETGAADRFPGVRPECLDAIRDKARFAPQEYDAWFHLLGILAKTDPATLRHASIGRISRLQLSEQSKEYRGEVVTVRGTIRRAHRLRAPENDYGIESYYQTWLEPDDGSAAPIVVYCLELPEGFPVGMTLAEDVEATGFYFKRWLYEAADGLELAPVVLARTIQPRPAPPASSVPGGIVGLIVVVGVALALAAAVVIFVAKRTGKR